MVTVTNKMGLGTTLFQMDPKLKTAAGVYVESTAFTVPWAGCRGCLLSAQLWAGCCDEKDHTSTGKGLRSKLHLCAKADVWDPLHI